MSRISLRYDRLEFEAKVGMFLHSLQILPNNISEYFLAFIHRSVLNESTRNYSESNERLEFLGDAVLELVITEALFNEFPEKPEWVLTDIRSALVRGRNLAVIAERLNIPDIIQLSRGEYHASGHKNPYILANTLEAFIGALYRDQGIIFVRQWILSHVYSMLGNIMEENLYIDPKSALQEFTQEVWWYIPTYRVTGEEWQDHNKTYIVDVVLDDITLGVGRWSSKKKAEQQAAQDALSHQNTWESLIRLDKKAPRSSR